MRLKEGTSKRIILENIEELIKAGYTKEQALMIVSHFNKKE